MDLTLTNAENSHAAPLRSPNADTASQKGYNIAASSGPGGEPQRRTFQNPTTEGDKRLLYAQGEPLAKDASGSGANWRDGLRSDVTTGPATALESRIAYEGTVTATDMSRATDAREKERIGIFGTSAAYVGSSGRVTSQPIGRDLNPLGRGDGFAYLGGSLNLWKYYPALPKHVHERGSGSSINNTIGQGTILPPTGKDNSPTCCTCAKWLCPYCPGENSPFDDSNKCCCPEECGDYCVGEGGIICGMPCEIPYNPCENRQGNAARSSFYSPKSCSRCRKFKDVNDDDEGGGIHEINWDVIKQLIKCARDLKDIVKKLKDLRNLTWQELKQLFEIEECCLLLRDITCNVCLTEMNLTPPECNVKLNEFCVCCGFFDDYGDRQWPDDPRTGKRMSCVSCLHWKIGNCFVPMLKELAKCFNNQLKKIL